jgi:hypothetical protein
MIDDDAPLMMGDGASLAGWLAALRRRRRGQKNSS